jgi:hypothetical protein
MYTEKETSGVRLEKRRYGDKTKQDWMGGHVARMGEMTDEKCTQILIGST